PQDVQTASVRHMDIEQDEVPLLLAQQIERLVAGGRFAHRVDAGIRFQKLLESGANHRVIAGAQPLEHSWLCEYPFNLLYSVFRLQPSASAARRLLPLK